MTKRASRRGRLGDLLQRELSTLIRDEISDPRLGMVTISGVDVNEDLSFARVYVTVMEDDKIKSSVDVLNGASGFFRTQLAKHLSLRVVPKMHFIYDESLVKGSRMDQLLSSLNGNDEQE